MLFCDARNRLERLARIHRAGRIVGIDDDDRSRPRRNQRLDLLGIRFEAALRPAGVVHRAAAVQIHCGSPQRIIGTRHQNFIVIGEQRAQYQIDELADAVADEYLLGADSAHAAILLLHHHRFARRKNALLVTVAFAVTQVLDDRQPHRLRGAKSEYARVADVQ